MAFLKIIIYTKQIKLPKIKAGETGFYFWLLTNVVLDINTHTRQ